MRVVSSDEQLRHTPKHEFALGKLVSCYEIPERVASIQEALGSDGGFEFEEPAEHGLEPIEAVHHPEMVAYLERAWGDWSAAEDTTEVMPDTILHPALREGMGAGRRPSAPLGAIGSWCFDTATPIVEGTYGAARAAVDVALSCGEAALEGETAIYGLCRPPGHHAANAVFGGYCYFNNAAIVAEHIAKEAGEPVAILDVDYHHGNGTQQIFYERADVMYVSLHGDPDRAYPYFAGYADETGRGAGAGTTLNLPLPEGTDDETYLMTLDRGLEAIASSAGSILIVSLGLDTYRLDPICDLSLTTSAYHEIGRRVAELNRRTVVLQEGGYHVGHLGENVRAWLRGLAGRSHDPHLADLG